MLDKPEFDCANLGDFYDCGCNGDEEEAGKKPAPQSDAEGTDHDGPAVEISKEA